MCKHRWKFFWSSVKTIKTFNEFVEEYIIIYGSHNWSYTTYGRYISIIERHIIPVFGNLKLTHIDNRMINHFYHSLHITHPPIAPSTIRVTHKILQTMFNKAIEWNLISKNPMVGVITPKISPVARIFWTPEQMALALEYCNDIVLSLAIQLAFSCTLRKGEILALRWEDIDFAKQTISIDKEIIRVTKDAITKISRQDIIFTFPEQITSRKTCMIVKRPKTKSSIRKVFAPSKLLEELKEYRDIQATTKSEGYSDYNLIIRNLNGMPYNDKNLTSGLRDITVHTGLPEVCFHSIRHSSITYKLMLSNGDIKAVQGDSGHSQSKMVTDLYSHVLDNSRRELSEKLNKEFYNNGNICGDDLKKILETLESQPLLRQKLKEMLCEM